MEVILSPLGHGEELAFVFHSAPLFGYKFSAEEETLSNQMITYWTNLAKYGDPNGESDTSWPAYTNQTRNIIHFLTPENKVTFMKGCLRRYGTMNVHVTG